MFIFTSVIYQFSTKRVFGDPNIAEMLENMIEALKKYKRRNNNLQNIHMKLKIEQHEPH